LKKAADKLKKYKTIESSKILPEINRKIDDGITK
jgi:hypothetical protein